MNIKMKLERQAKKSGGDRYKGTTTNTAEELVIYFPQSISRPNGKEPAKEIDITIDV